MIQNFFLQEIPPCKVGGWEEIPPVRECGEPLVDITERDERVCYIASYWRQGLDGALERCWVREGVWTRLRDALSLLPEDWSIQIFDGLRTLRTQQAIYNGFRRQFLAKEPGLREEELEAAVEPFVAKPARDLARPAPHMTGGAVDLTLCFQGKPLNMGTGFDDLTGRARTRWYEEAEERDEEVRKNRRLLYHVMSAAGFVNYDGEWWHYSYGDRQWARQTGAEPVYGYCLACDI